MASKKAYGNGLGSFGLELLANKLSKGDMLRKNYLEPAHFKDPKTGQVSNVYVVDGMSVAQGPNYALAKRMQHWRAMIEFENGATVSSVVAPSTATLSVIHNKNFAWAYGGMPYFGYEIFKQETCSAVMTAVLINDLLNPNSPKNPKNKEKFGIRTPLELFSTESLHGGLWRSAYKMDSIGKASAIIYFAGEAKIYAVSAFALLVGVGAYNYGLLAM